MKAQYPSKMAHGYDASMGALQIFVNADAGALNSPDERLQSLTMKRLALAITMLMVCANLESAENPITASHLKKTSFAEFILTLKMNGQDNMIRPNIAPVLGMTPNAPTKAFIAYNINPKSPARPGKTCNVITSDEATNTSSDSVLFLDGRIADNNNVANYYVTDSTGKLLRAYHAVGKRDDKQQAVRGSGKATTLDVTSPAVQRDFKKELDFWLSGKYKKFLKPAPEAKTAGENASFREK